MRDEWGMIPDDELDGLFQEAADGYKPSFDPEAWRRMEAKLDSEKPTPKPFNRRLLGGLLIALLLLLGGGYYAYHPLTGDSASQPNVLTQSGNANRMAAKNDVGIINKNPENPLASEAVNIKKGASETENFLKNEGDKTETKINTVLKVQPENQTMTVGTKKDVERKIANDVGMPTSSPVQKGLTVSKLKAGTALASLGKSIPGPGAKKSHPTDNGKTTTNEAIVSDNKHKENLKPRGKNMNKTLSLNSTKSADISFNSKHQSQEKLSRQQAEPALSEGTIGTKSSVFKSTKTPAFKQSSNRDLQATEKLLIDNQAITVNESASNPINELSETPTKLFSAEVTALAIRSNLQWPKWLLPAVVVAANPEVALTPIKPVRFERPKFGARVIMAPDVNRVGSSNPFAIGSSWGAIVEYEMVRRFRIQTGFIRTSKLYSAKLEDYSPPTGTWKYGVKPIGINADCKILDLPLNFRWDVVRQKKYDLFINTGLSSYLMLNEKYDYEYDPQYPSTTHLLWAWAAKRGSDHWLSTYNLSVGYERQLRRGFTIQVEPYLKMPLKGVGFGKVNIMSTGVYISAKYQFFRKQK